MPARECSLRLQEIHIVPLLGSIPLCRGLSAAAFCAFDICEIITILVEKHVNYETIKIVGVILDAVILTVYLTKNQPNCPFSKDLYGINRAVYSNPVRLGNRTYRAWGPKLDEATSNLIEFGGGSVLNF